MKKTLALVLSLAMLLGCFGVAGAEDEVVVRVGMGYDPNTLDFAEQNLDSSMFIMEATAGTLIRSLGNNEYAPGLAESWTVSDDAKVWTFKLREGMTYADGVTPITAEDVYYNVKRLLDPAAGHGNATFSLLNSLEYYEGNAAWEDVGIKVIDDLTIEYTFVNPAYESSFIDTSTAGAMEEAFVEPLGQEYGSSADKYLSYGPFMVSEWLSDASVTLVRNPYYYDADSVKVDKIIVLTNVSGDVAVDMMLTGELDVMDFTDPQKIATLESAGYALKGKYLESYQGLNINLAGKSEETGRFISNANFRKALSLATNRTALTLSVRQGEIPAGRLSYETEPAYAANPDYAAWPLEGDAELAKEYLNKALEELGATADELPTFELMCYEAQGSINTLAAYQDMWKKTLGIETEINAVTIQVMISNAMSGNFDFWLGGNAPTLPDACESYLQGYTSMNFTPLRNYKNPEFDALYNAAVSSPTLEERLQNYAAVEEFFCENVLALITTWTINSVYAPASAEGLYITDRGVINVQGYTK